MRARRLSIAGIAFAVAATWFATLLLLTLGRRSGDASADLQPNAIDSPVPGAVLWPPAAPTAHPTVVPTPAPPAIESLQAPVVDSEPPEPPPPPAQEQLPAPEPREWLDADFAAQVLDLVNAERAARGAPALSPNDALTRSAQNYAQVLIRLNALDHAAGGSDLLSRVEAAGYTANAQLGEVLWRGGGAFSSETPVAGWLSSPAHREIILDPTYREAGIGCYFREDRALYEARCMMVVAG